MKTLFTFLSVLLLSIAGYAQNSPISITVFDFETQPDFNGWFKDNDQIQFSISSKPEDQATPQSKGCLVISWNPVPDSKPMSWMTDIKADGILLPDSGDSIRKAFLTSPWISFLCTAGNADTVWIQPLFLTKDHAGKWGSKTLFPVVPGEWKRIKINLAALDYDNWGKIPGPIDFKTGLIRTVELGVRNGNTNPKKKIEVRFDDIKISNFEPD